MKYPQDCVGLPSQQGPIEHETEELRQFREEWRQEVEGRLEHESSLSSAAPNSTPSKAVGITSNGIEINDRSNIHLIGSRSAAALDLYTQAVKLEVEGNHNVATALYRRAFRLQEDIDKVYYRSHMVPELGTRELSQDVEALSLAQRAPVLRVNLKTISRSLQHILAAFPLPEELSFEREIEIQPFVFGRLPDELLIAILQCFVRTADTRSVERFASVCRKARILTLEPSLWRALVDLIYVPPQLNYSPNVLLPSFQYDYRNLYVNQPRVRLDGIYIAACHYVRKGYSENAWVNVTHLIMYYRYLRFLPNGVALSLLSSDSTASPQQTIPHLKLEAPLMRGMQVGQWTLELPSDDVDGEEKQGGNDEDDGPIVIVDGLLDVGLGGTASATATPKYSFKMRLGLRSKPIGRWNKLDIIKYESVHLSTDEATPLPLKHEQPYWFSKVKSYGSGMR